MPPLTATRVIPVLPCKLLPRGARQFTNLYKDAFLASSNKRLSADNFHRGMAPVAHVLFNKFMKFNPQNPSWLNRDRFVLS